MPNADITEYIYQYTSQVPRLVPGLDMINVYYIVVEYELLHFGQLFYFCSLIHHYKLKNPKISDS